MQVLGLDVLVPPPPSSGACVILALHILAGAHPLPHCLCCASLHVATGAAEMHTPVQRASMPF